jgi:hypothetical protein
LEFIHHHDFFNASWSRYLPEKLIVAELIKKFPTFHETQRFIAVFIRAWFFKLFFCPQARGTYTDEIE